MLAGKISVLLDEVRQGVRAFVPVIILVLFTLIGGAIFMAIEGPNEQYELEKLKHEREQLLEDMAFRLNTIKHMSPIEAYNHTVQTLKDYRDGLGVHEVQLNQTKWSFVGIDLLLAHRVYTTIGYGNIICHTTVGRVLTVIYAFIGIPLALISLFALGQLFAKACMVLWKFLTRTCGCVSKDLERKMTRLGPKTTVKEQEDAESEETNDEDLLNFPIFFLIFVTVLWIFLSAYIIYLMESGTLDYGTSLYFTLISFLTIGFGDVIVSNPKFIIPLACLLLIGLSLVSTVLTNHSSAFSSHSHRSTFLLVQKQIEAVASGMKDSIDQEYMTALQRAEEEEEAEEARENGADVEKGKGGKGKKKKEKREKSLEEVLSRMPLKSRILYKIMPAGNRKQLAKHAEARQRVGLKWVQTDDWLLEGGKPGLENINY
ncbi:Ion channel [Aphelenchoides fujianensis]|nr:Ion channel [Aphelenchoides fujianensis]